MVLEDRSRSCTPTTGPDRTYAAGRDATAGRPVVRDSRDLVLGVGWSWLRGLWSQNWRRMTGRLGNVRPISVNPAATNMVSVPVNSADPLTLVAVNLSTSTG